MGSNKDWLGQEIDDRMLDELGQLGRDQRINPIGEWGEYHTIVLDCPIYNKKITILKSEITWKKTRGYLEIKEAELQPKTL
jgi:diphthamide synthase (EF-2-diphthine--ammonia ligase)